MSEVPPAPIAAAAPSDGEMDMTVDGDETLTHLQVGRSLHLSSGADELRKVYISDPEVISTFSPDPHHILVTAKAPGESTFEVWDVSGNTKSYSISADLDVTQLRQALAEAFPHDKIEAKAEGGLITLSGKVGAKDDSDRAEKLADGYSKHVTNAIVVDTPRDRQVLLKVRFAEVDRSRLDQVGFNFLSGGKTSSMMSTGQYTSFTAPTVGTGISTSSVSVSNPLNLLLFNSAYNVGAALEALEQENVLQILAEPDLVAISGHEANFLSGGEFPFPVVEGGTTGGVAVTVEFRPYGVKLDFTPTVLPDGTIHLHVAPEVSALDYTNEVEIDGYDIPAIDTRKASTDVELKSGQTFVISGLLDQRLTDQFSKMPGLSSIPILGQFFKSKSVDASHVELMVVVTPTLVDPLNAQPALPKLSKPYMNRDKFDKSLPGKASQTDNY